MKLTYTCNVAADQSESPLEMPTMNSEPKRSDQWRERQYAKPSAMNLDPIDGRTLEIESDAPDVRRAPRDMFRTDDTEPLALPDWTAQFKRRRDDTDN